MSFAVIVQFSDNNFGARPERSKLSSISTVGEASFHDYIPPLARHDKKINFIARFIGTLASKRTLLSVNTRAGEGNKTLDFCC
jgi:hypothetical protein